MRTTLLTLVLVVGFVLAAPVAAAADDPVNKLLEDLGILPPPADPRYDPIPEELDIEDPTVDLDSLLGDLTATLLAVTAPVAVAGKVLGFLGLVLVEGMFGGMEEGGHVVAASMNSVAANPITSFAFASMSIAF